MPFAKLIANKYLLIGPISIILIASVAIGAVLNTINLTTNNYFVAYSILIASSIWLLTFILLYQQKLMRNILLSLIGMLIFAFCMVPLYNVFCNITGLNGKVDLSNVARSADGVDVERTVTIEFVVNYNQDMPWEFKPKHHSLTLHPGEVAHTAYYALNPTKATMRAQAIPSISPAQATKHFKKIECFCFNSQQLGPKESAHFPIEFYIDTKLPKEITRITLSYTLFDITDNKELNGYNPHKHA